MAYPEKDRRAKASGSTDILPHSLWGVALVCGLLLVGCSLITEPDTQVGLSFVSQYDTPGWAHDVVVIGRYAYLADGPNGLLVLDVANVFYPEFAGRCALSGNAVSVRINPQSQLYAYVITSGANWAVQVIDIAAPENPVLVTQLDTLATDALDLAFRGSYALIAAGQRGLRGYDISQPAAPQRVGQLEQPFALSRVAVESDTAYVIYRDPAVPLSRVVRLDISNPSALLPGLAQQLFFDLPGPPAVMGDRMYVAFPDSGLRIFDVTHNPPLALGGYRPRERSAGLCLAPNGVYLANTTGGVILFDVSNASQPMLTALYDTPGSAQGVFADGQYVFVADGSAGLIILRYER